MSLALAVCLLVGTQPVADPRVSIVRTAKVAALLREISTQSGVRLEAGVRRADEVLIVSMQDVPLSDALKQVAWATYGRWEKLGSGFRLVPDTDAERAAEKEYVRWQTREAATAIARYEKKMDRAKVARTGGVHVLEPGKAPQYWPADLALARAIKEVKPEATIFLHPDSPCVYDTRPGPAQYKLSDAVLSTFNDATRGGSVGLAVRAIVTCDYRFETGTAKLSLFDEQGNLCGEATATFKLYDEESPRPSEFADEVPKEVVPLSAESKFYVRPETALPAGAYGIGPNDSVRGRINDIAERLRHPELYEPMATFATDVWRAVARWKGCDLVANVDDAYMYPAWAAKLPDLRQAFRTAGGYNAELRPGWLLARPSLASTPWRHRADRAALGKLAGAKPQTELSLLEATGAFAGLGDVAPDPWEMSQYLAWAEGPRPEIFNGWDIARIYGLVSAPARRDWLSGIPVSLDTLSVTARRAMLAVSKSPLASLSSP